MKKRPTIILRILISPLLLCIILIRYIYAAFEQTFLAVKYGGEWITYNKNSYATIQDIYNKLTEKNNGNV